MSDDELCALKIANIAAEDSVLFMWATYPKLLSALRVMKAWGFEYKTVAFTWVKRNRKSASWFFGLGHWTRANPEICLLGVRGRAKRISASVSSVIDAPIERHSKKPDIVREKIVQLMGDVPRIELFSRVETPGWKSVGFDLGSDVRDLG